MATRLDIIYSKLMFKFQTSKRFALYRKLASLLRNDFTLMDALHRIERVESKDGTKPNEPFAIVMRAWQAALERGFSFADATRGWVPANETLMLVLGDVSKLANALDNVIRVGEGEAKIKSALLSAVAYPAFLFALTFIIIIAVGLYLVPPLQEAAGSSIVWKGVARTLVDVSHFSNEYWLLFLSILVGAAGLIWLSLSNLSGRVRVPFDSIPPWNMYKISVSVGWLMSLAAIVASGGSLVAALHMLAENSTPYLKSILESTLRFIANGDNLGSALRNTGRRFPNDEIIGDLQIYADMKEFDENLSKIANDYLDQSVRKMQSLSSVMNSIGILLVSIVIGWVVFGTFEMQDQITSALS